MAQVERPLLKSVPGKPDWWLLPKDQFHLVRGAVGFYPVKHGIVIHRTHLPLLHDQFEVEGFEQPLGGMPDLEGVTLRPYQVEGVRFIQARCGTILNYKMRLGKTAIAVASHEPSLGPLFVVAPLPTRPVWLAWFKKRWPHIEPAVFSGRSVDAQLAKRAKIIFCHYDILASWQVYMPIGTLVFDESHLLSNRRSKRTQAAFFLAGQAKKVICSTGTPVWNEPSQIYAQLALTSKGGFGAYSHFTRRYANGRPGDYGWEARGTANEEELQLRLREVMIQRSWEDVMPELPATQRTLAEVTLDTDDKLELDKEVESLRESSRPTVIGDMARLRRLLGIHKKALAVTQAAAFLAEGESVVVWTWHRDLAHALSESLREKGHRSFVVDGGQSQDQRDQVLAEWRRKVGALAITLAVGQAGIDLSHARHAIFAEVDYTPAVVAQAEMRTFHPSRPMSVEYLVTDHRLDRRIISILVHKVQAAQRLGIPAAESALDVLMEAIDTPDEGMDVLDFFFGDESED